MGDFEFLFALFGLLFGLIVAELSLRFADAIDRQDRRPIGILTPMLALLVLTDVTCFWPFIWSVRTSLKVSWHLVFSGLTLAVVYFLAASLVFPRSERDMPSLDTHYWRRKRAVVGGVLFVDLIVYGSMLAIRLPAWNDWWFYFYQVGYFGALIGLMFSRTRRLDIAFLSLGLFVNICSGFDLTPGSAWAREIGIPYAAWLGGPAS